MYTRARGRRTRCKYRSGCAYLRIWNIVRGIIISSYIYIYILYHAIRPNSRPDVVPEGPAPRRWRNLPTAAHCAATLDMASKTDIIQSDRIIGIIRRASVCAARARCQCSGIHYALAFPCHPAARNVNRLSSQLNIVSRGPIDLILLYYIWAARYRAEFPYDMYIYIRVLYIHAHGCLCNDHRTMTIERNSHNFRSNLRYRRGRAHNIIYLPTIYIIYAMISSYKKRPVTRRREMCTQKHIGAPGKSHRDDREIITVSCSDVYRVADVTAITHTHTRICMCI